MLFSLFSNSKDSRQSKGGLTTYPALPYSWIKIGKLAIGPMPRSEFHWQQLESDGFLYRFSCCYPYEHIYAPIPANWKSNEVSLPDHRSQDLLTTEKLIFALNEAMALVSKAETPVYLHCFAGQERSVLIAVGITCILEKKDLFDSLNYVRECHKIAKPLYHHLDLLEQVVKHYRT
ncbi:MAG: hypothetical protein ACK41W_02635 [Cyanobacteriota bacterium]|jgi:hypothetical protein